MKEGQTLLKTLEGGMWKWHVKHPGDGRTRSNFECNAHELRVVKVNDVCLHDPGQRVPWRNSKGEKEGQLNPFSGTGEVAALRAQPGR